jgi:hypothetical protein
LTAVAALATLLLAATTSNGVEPEPRFASDDATYAVDGWRVGPADMSGRQGVAFINREYTAVDGVQLQLGITTSPEAKSVYRAGADVPFLGSGYSVEPAPTELVARMPGREALIARRGSQTWLQIASYGERRGLVGNGVSGWGLAIFDTLLGSPNDYYLVRIVGLYDPVSASDAVQLADTLFPRLSGWYLK